MIDYRIWLFFPHVENVFKAFIRVVKWKSLYVSREVSFHQSEKCRWKVWLVVGILALTSRGFMVLPQTLSLITISYNEL